MEALAKCPPLIFGKMWGFEEKKSLKRAVYYSGKKSSFFFLQIVTSTIFSIFFADNLVCFWQNFHFLAFLSIHFYRWINPALLSKGLPHFFLKAADTADAAGAAAAPMKKKCKTPNFEKKKRETSNSKELYFS